MADVAHLHCMFIQDVHGRSVVIPLIPASFQIHNRSNTQRVGVSGSTGLAIAVV